MKTINSLVLTALLISSNVNADTLIHAGRMIDGETDAAFTEMTIRVDGTGIKSIENGYTSAGPDDSVIDLKSHTVLPGLMDMHVHLTGEYSKDSRLNRFTTNEADYAIVATVYAKRTLEAGFTVVRNLGDAFNVTVALRKAIEKGDVPGPKIFTAAKTIGTHDLSAARKVLLVPEIPVLASGKTDYVGLKSLIENDTYKRLLSAATGNSEGQLADHSAGHSEAQIATDDAEPGSENVRVPPGTPPSS